MNNDNLNQIWRALVGVALVLGVLRLFPLSSLGPAAVVLAMVGLGWLVYQFLEPFCLLPRRALLKELFNADSFLRSMWWKARIRRLLLCLATFVTATVALMTADAMTGYEWAFLLASLPVFWFALMVARLGVGPQWQGRYHLIFGLGQACLLTLLLLVCALVSWQIFVVEVPMTVHMAWHEVLVQAYTHKSAAAVTPQVGWMLGLNAAISDLAWHVMQVARAEGESARWVYRAGCALLLGWSAAKLASIWLVLLGVIVVAARSREPSMDELQQGASHGMFVGALALLVVMFVGLERVSLSLDTVSRPWKGSTFVDVSLWSAPDPCKELRLRERREVSQHAVHELDRQRSQLDGRLLALVDQHMEDAFAPVEHAVDRFLDWNFSLEGQYAQLAYLAASVASSGTFERFIAAKVNDHLHAVLDPALDRASELLHAEMAQSIEAVFRHQEALVARLVQEASCLEAPKPTINLEDYMRKSLVGAGAGMGIIGTRTANRMGARMVSQAATKRAMAAVVTKGATRTVTTFKGGLAGFACGPYAPFCIVGFAAATWFGTDILINHLDEASHREEMRAEMMNVLEAQKVAFREQVRVDYLEVSAQVFEELQEYQAARFNIYRDGG